jgi:hypothetical protein
VRIGSNVLRNVTALVSVGDTVPFLVGKGSTPRMWLSIPTDRTGSQWYPLVKDNFSTHPDVKIEARPKVISVRTPQGTVLTALVASDNVLSIQKLDLRPFGLNVYADEKGLFVMGNRLSKNEFQNVQVVVGVGTNS